MRAIRPVLLVLMLAVVVVSGCGGSEDGEDLGVGSTTSGDTTTSTDDTTASSSDPGTETTSSSKPSTSTTTAPEGSVLRRRDARPSDVAAQANYYGGGPPPRGFACDQNPDPASSSPPTENLSVLVDAEMAAGEATTICVGKYEVDVPLKIQVRHKDRSIWQKEVPGATESVGPSATFTTMPLDPTGTYTVVVTQGERRGTGTFTLGIAKDQPILVVAESPGRGVEQTQRGRPIHIGLAGWAPRQRVELALYRSASSEPGGDAEPAEFITLLPVTVDANGQQLHTLATRADDPPGCYVVNTRPAVEPAGPLGRLGASIVEFCLS